jgi:predicted O-methyltransferase YrrM
LPLSPLTATLLAVILLAVLVLQVVILLRLRDGRRADHEPVRRPYGRGSSPRRQQTTDRRIREVLEGPREVLAQVEALMDLYATVEPRRPMPSTQGWASAPTTMRALIDLLYTRRPEVVVECGSGSSSIWIGYALRKIGSGRCISLEHLPEYAEVTRALVREHGLDDVVEVRLAPLTQLPVDGDEFQWYALEALEDVENIGLVFVDGPPGDSGPMARFPAMPLLERRCAPDAVFLIDDTTRPDEAETARRWADELGARPLDSDAAGSGWRALTLP